MKLYIDVDGVMWLGTDYGANLGDQLCLSFTRKEVHDAESVR